MTNEHDIKLGYARGQRAAWRRISAASFSLVVFAFAVLLVITAAISDKLHPISMAIPAIGLLLSTSLWLIGFTMAAVSLLHKKSRSLLGLVALLLNSAPLAVLLFFIIRDLYNPSQHVPGG